MPESESCGASEYMDKIATQGSVLTDYLCLLFCIWENAIVVLVEVLWYSVLAVRSSLKEDLFFTEEIVERAVKI